MNQGGNSGSGVPGVTHYQAPSYNDPHHPLNHAPMVDNSAATDSVFGGNMPTGSVPENQIGGAAVPGLPATHKRRNSILGGAGAATVISSNFYSSYALDPPESKKKFDPPETFQLNPTGTNNPFKTENPSTQPANPLTRPSIFDQPQANASPNATNTAATQPNIATQGGTSMDNYPGYQYDQAPTAPQTPPPITTPPQPAYGTPVRAGYYIDPNLNPNVGPQKEQPGAPAALYGNVDYLNYIAPTDTTKKPLKISNKVFMAGGIGVIVLVLLISVVAALGNAGAWPNTQLQQLGQDIADLQGVINYGNDEGKDAFATNDVSGINAESDLVAETERQKLTDKMPMAATDEDGNTEDIEASEDVTSKLDQAKANGELDREFIKVLSEHLDAVNDSLDATYQKMPKTGSKGEARTALEAAYKSFTELASRAKMVSDEINKVDDDATNSTKGTKSSSKTTDQTQPQTQSSTPAQ